MKQAILSLAKTSSRNLRTAITLLVFILAAAFSEPAYSRDSLISSRYDPYFIRYAPRYMPDYDWQWLKAQCYQESRLQPNAVSPAGASGLCQFMPGTWQDAVQAMGVTDIWRPQDQILAAAWYMNRQLRIWSGRSRTPRQKLPLAQASYNAGAGNIIKSQSKCGDALEWKDIKPCLHRVTGKNSKETIDYVRLIEWWYYELVIESAQRVPAKQAQRVDRCSCP